MKAGLAAIIAAAGTVVGCSSGPAQGAPVARTSSAVATVSRSAGCGQPPAVRGLASKGPGDVPLTFVSDGIVRSYRLGVPESYNKRKPVPLILDLHGANSNALQQSAYSAMPRAAAARGIVTVTRMPSTGTGSSVPRVRMTCSWWRSCTILRRTTASTFVGCTLLGSHLEPGRQQPQHVVIPICSRPSAWSPKRFIPLPPPDAGHCIPWHRRPCRPLWRRW